MCQLFLHHAGHQCRTDQANDYDVRSFFPRAFQKIIHKFEDNKTALFDAGMSYALSQIIDLLANDTDGIHLYTMNNPVVARRICEGIQHII